jgi:hypothetical protein
MARILSAIALAAQWMQFPTPGVPRLPDGKPNLNATTGSTTTAILEPSRSGSPSASTGATSGTSIYR